MYIGVIIRFKTLAKTVQLDWFTPVLTGHGQYLPYDWGELTHFMFNHQNEMNRQTEDNRGENPKKCVHSVIGESIYIFPVGETTEKKNIDT